MQPIVSTDRPHCCEHETVAVDEAACRTPVTLDLDNRCRHGVHGICHLSREFIQHGAIVADADVAIITRTGRNGHALCRQAPICPSTLLRADPSADKRIALL
jgi:hypothetical protein